MKSFLCLCVLALSGHHGAAFVHRIPAAPPPVLSRGRALVQVAIPITVEPTQGPTGRERLEILVQRYVHACETKPFRTKGLSAAAVQGIGDVLSQHLMALTTPHAAFVWDARRTLTFVMIGLFYKGPALHLWYKVLGKIAHWTKVRKGFSETKQSLTALTVDQTVGVAIFYPLYYIMYEVFSSLLSFRAPNLYAVQAKMVTTVLPIILAQYYVWPGAQFLSFKYCPAPLRVLYTNGVAVFWNCFLCARLAAS